MVLRWLAIPVCLAVLGCGDRWDEVSFVDEGQVCLHQEGTTVTVSVLAPGCLSSSCTRDVEASCTATLVGDRIEVTSDISWEEDGARFAACTGDCGSAIATCELDALPDGEYTVQLGSEVQAVTVPLGDDPCVF